MATFQGGRTVVECPFCHEHCVKAFHRPSFLQGSTSSISSGSRVSYHRRDEEYIIQGPCPKCGATEKDIEKWYNGQYEEKKLTHEERLKRLKESGLPMKFGSSKS